jgi:RNA polymerase sigma-70 factor (ECF subfamily)
MWDTKLLFEKHSQEINHYLRKCGHGRDEAADLTQDVFMRVLCTTSPARDQNLRAYLYTVARNLSTDVYRRRQIVRFTDIAEEDYRSIPDPNPTPERIASDRQQLMAMSRALAELPPKTRQAFELYRFGDLTIAQVAGEINLSISRTWMLIQKACAHLRKSVQEDAALEPSSPRNLNCPTRSKSWSSV